MAKTSERQTDNEAREVGLVIGTVGPVDDGNEDALAAQVELLTQAVVSARVRAALGILSTALAADKQLDLLRQLNDMREYLEAWQAAQKTGGVTARPPLPVPGDNGEDTDDAMP
jgi:hypothetical protein